MVLQNEERGEKMLQKELNQECKDVAYELYKKHGFKEV
jgi:hypothetical protein